MRIFATAVLLMLGCGSTYTALANPASEIQADRSARTLRELDTAFKLLDTNHDRRISRSEARAEKGLAGAFDGADLDRDDSLTAFEYELLHFRPEDEAAFVRR